MAQGQLAQQRGLAHPRPAAHPGPLAGLEAAQALQLGPSADQAGLEPPAGGLGGALQAQAQLTGLALDGLAGGVLGGPQQAVEAGQFLGLGGRAARQAVGGLGQPPGLGEAGQAGLLLGLPQQGGAQLAGQALAGLPDPLLELGPRLAQVQALGEGAPVEPEGLAGAARAQVLAQLRRVAPQARPHPLLVGLGRAQLAQVVERHRQVVHGVGGLGPEELGREAPGLGALQRQVGQQQQGLLPAEFAALELEAAQAFEPHGPSLHKTIRAR